MAETVAQAGENETITLDQAEKFIFIWKMSETGVIIAIREMGVGIIYKRNRAHTKEIRSCQTWEN